MPYFTLQPPQQVQNRYSEPDNRDWRGRSGQLPANADERSWDNLKENREFGNASQVNRQDQQNSQYGRAQISSNQGVKCMISVYSYVL